MNNLFKNDDLILQLIDRMGEHAENINDFAPFNNVAHDYAVLEWMRDVVRLKYIQTYAIFTSYISGAMHQYVVGDYTRGAMLAIGIIDSSKKTGNE